MLQNYLGYPLYQMQHVEVQKSGSFVVTERAECMRKKKSKRESGDKGILERPSISRRKLMGFSGICNESSKHESDSINRRFHE